MAKSKGVAVQCEFSGIVSNAFHSMDFPVSSYDLIPSETFPNHFIGAIEKYPRELWSSFDLIVSFPPCTFLAVSGARWFAERQEQQKAAIEFVDWIWNLPCKHIAIENPIGVLSTKWRKPDQIIQPYMFGHGETKATCLWLKNLPLLKPTNIVSGRIARVHHESPGPDRWKNRSRTYTGIASAMADQWGKYVTR